MHFGFRLGKRRRALLREAARGETQIGRGDTRSEKAARQRAAMALVRAGLAERCRVLVPGPNGMCWRAGLRLTLAGRDVVRAFWPQVRNGSGAIRWRRFALGLGVEHPRHKTAAR